MSNRKNQVYISNSTVKSDNIIDSINKLLEITKNIELTGGCDYDEDLLTKLTKIHIKESINFVLHSYFPPPKKHFILNFANTDKQTRSFIEQSIAFVKKLNIDYYSIHAGFKKDSEVKDGLLLSKGSHKYAISDIYNNIKWFKSHFQPMDLALENLYPVNSDKEICFFSHINEIVNILEEAKNIFLLLDFGHLKVSSRILGFNFLDAIELLFARYSKRIKEIHLSENQGNRDEHLLIYSDSIQYMIIRKYKELIKNNSIKITIETRNCSIKEIQNCYTLINNALL